MSSQASAPQEPNLDEIEGDEVITIVGLFASFLIFLILLRILCIVVIDICILRDMDAARRSIRWMMRPCLFCGHYLCGYEMHLEDMTPTRPETMTHDATPGEQSKLERLLSELSAEKKHVLFASILERQNCATDGQTVIEINEKDSEVCSENGVTQDDNICPICLESFDVDNDIIVSPKVCNHKFHDTCILSWLEEHTDCPNCRCEMITEADVRSVVEEEEKKESLLGKKNLLKNTESRARFIRTL
mmetsp:Transcript_9428/g.14494  ORF Transcript_9428/g.14494 Transcript_9428/m.14494 type:complete len:246 (+) Transcript_9428:203-940(+)